MGSITARAYRNFCQYLLHFGKGNIHKILTKNYEFDENQLIKSHASLRSINEYLSVLTTFIVRYRLNSGFGGLGVACWPLVPKFAGSNPAEAVGFLRAKKSSARLPSEGEVKPSVPCRRFAACK